MCLRLNIWKKESEDERRRAYITRDKTKRVQRHGQYTLSVSFPPLSSLLFPSSSSSLPFLVLYIILCVLNVFLPRFWYWMVFRAAVTFLFLFVFASLVMFLLILSFCFVSMSSVRLFYPLHHQRHLKQEATAFIDSPVYLLSCLEYFGDRTWRGWRSNTRGETANDQGWNFMVQEASPLFCCRKEERKTERREREGPLF